jgi:hypothetical protein
MFVVGFPTFRSVAIQLNVGEKAIRSMAQAGALPGFKVRGLRWFRRSDIGVSIVARREYAKARPEGAGGDE